MERRYLLQGGAGLVAAAIAGEAPAWSKKSNSAKAETALDTAYTPPGRGVITGKGVGDFDFLAGEWMIRHQRLKDGTKDEWQRFDSSATVYRVLDGMGSIEELRKAGRTYMGMGIRVWLPEQKKWADHWTSSGNGVVNPPQFGAFIDGEGVFISEEEVSGTKWQYRGVWDRITPKSCRWHQSSSNDGGKRWEWNWWMEWTRLS